jgi:hypothetical protein
MNTASVPVQRELPEFYFDALNLLETANVPFLIGGAFAQSRYTKRYRETKDLDLIIRRADVPAAMAACEQAGYRTELTFPHWLAKIRDDQYVLDVVFSSGNGVLEVDEDWFTYAVDNELMGRPVKLCPVEELLWSKAFIQERERYDGNDVLHLLHARGAVLDWNRLLARFSEHWAILLGHLVLFMFVYPDRRGTIPKAVVDDLVDRFQHMRPDPNNPLCLGTLLSRQQYLFDIGRLGYADARVEPHGSMTPVEAEIWTDAIERDKPQQS